MAQVTVEVAGRRYALACGDGEEDQLTALAAMVDKKASDLNAKLGSVGEARLMLMTAILMAEEVRTVQSGGMVASNDAFISAEDVAGLLDTMTEKVEHIVESLAKA